MICGFDYGTSNCAVGIVKADDNAVTLLPLDNGKIFMPSALYASHREFICESVGLQLPPGLIKDEFIQLRSNALAQARRVREQHHLSMDDKTIFVGAEAFEHYFSYPEEGYFVKSPKSFLGASGLQPQFVHFFEDIITAMMQHVKHQAELQTGEPLSKTVIGRPVNFQGLHAEKSNQQAIEILSIAAARAGFEEVEFLFEPLAAAMDFEQRLTTNKVVLVVDIGGGTSDCAMVRMGPDYRHKTQRDEDFLGHSGERIGGNDLDIQLAGCQLMPLFGLGGPLKNGLPMPSQVFWKAVQTNDVASQNSFSHLKTLKHIEQLQRDSVQPHLLQRLLNMREEKQNHHLVRSAEQAKINLSDHLLTHVDLSYIEKDLSCDIQREQLSAAIARPQARMLRLMEEAINQAGIKPDLIYVTGGSAKSPILRQAIEDKMGAIDVVDGDHFGSVAAGLTVWAQRIYA